MLRSTIGTCLKFMTTAVVIDWLVLISIPPKNIVSVQVRQLEDHDLELYK